MARRSHSPFLSPVLLLGAGTGEATCGILYLASYLRRHGLEAFVRLDDADETEAELTRTLEQLLAHVRPRLVGISLKWFHHLARAQLVAQIVKRVDPSVTVVLGGNSASAWAPQLLEWPEVDFVALGDGEVPLLALARGTAHPPNVASRTSRTPTLTYVQGTNSDDVYYSHFDELFLSQLDRASFSGWVAPGKGCGENCVYCAGTRGLQKAVFGRATPFLRPEAAVRADHREIVPRTWQLRYDFAGSSPGFLSRAWEGLDLSRHAVTYFLWGVPPLDLVDLLAERLGRVYLVIDIGCFSESQRLELIRRGLLKPCPTDAALFDVIAHAKRHPNLRLEISGIAGLPFASPATLEEERALVERLLETGCAIGYQRLECQPGALVTEHPERFGLVSEARSFDDYLAFFARQPARIGAVPMIHFADPKLERAVARAFTRLDEAARRHFARAARVHVTGRTQLVRTAEVQRTTVGDWLGAFRVPAQVAKAPLTAVRAVDGAGLACVPSLDPRRFSDAALQQGEDAAALLAVLDAFARASSVEAAVGALQRRAGLLPPVSRELIEHLTAGRFLQPT